jgi:hypothetical protein
MNNPLVLITIIVKVLYILLRCFIVFYSRLKKKTLDILEEIAKKLEFIFEILMSILLILTFRSFYKKRNNTLHIDHETRILYFTFGIILIISADWSTLTTTNIAWKDFQKIVA